MQRLKLGFSPCPNDTFIFGAIINQQVDTEDIYFEPVIEDVETLNRKAFRQELDITKLSYHAFAYLAAHYVLLDAGSALGNNCGPLLISGYQHPLSDFEDKRLRIAIPGKYTTANFLFSLFFPHATNKVEMVFSEIEKAVLLNKADAGVIIHENRFTYASKGLKKIVDLGEYWESRTGYPIPLGGIAVSRNLPAVLQKKVNRIVRKSVEYVLANPAAVWNYVKRYAQETDDEVIRQHIGLYVNSYTVNLGDKGRKSITYMFDMAVKKGLIAKNNQPIFLN